MNNDKKDNNFIKNNILIIISVLVLIALAIFFIFQKINFSKEDNKVNNNTNNVVKKETKEIVKKDEKQQDKKDKKEFKNFSSITEKEFKDNFEGKNNVVVIDVRTKAEFEAGRIYKDALNIDVEKKDFSEKIAKLDKENKIYFIYCHSGRRSGIAKKIMEDKGFKEVYDLKGGIEEWKSKMYTEKKNKLTTVEDFKGKISFIAITSTSCHVCVDEVPKFYKDIYKKYGDKINFYVNVVGGSKPKWDFDFNQGNNPNFDYQALTKEECGYVPSWVILDKDGKVIDKVCGGGSEEAIKKLEKLLK